MRSRLFDLGSAGLGVAGSGVAPAPTINDLATWYAILSPHKLHSSYASATVRLRRSDTNAESDFTPGSDGWLLSSTILAWAGSAGVYLAEVYDQTSNGHHLTAAAAAEQPLIDLTGRYPVIDADGTAQYMQITSATSFARNIGGVAVAAVRKYDTTTSLTQNLVRFNNNAALPRVQMGVSSGVEGSDRIVGGRVLDADSYSADDGFAANTNWEVEIGRFDATNAVLKHDIEGVTVTKNPWQSAGVFSNTSSLIVPAVFSSGASTEYFNGKVTAVLLAQSALSDSVAATLNSRLSTLKATWL